MSIINPTHEPVYLPYNSVVATVSDIDVNNLYPLNDEAEKKQSHDAYCSNISVVKTLPMLDSNTEKELRL